MTGGDHSHSGEHPWFDVTRMDSGVFCIQEPGHVQSFLIVGSDRAALIDSGMGFVNMRTAVSALTDLPVLVLNTHWHFDHIGGNSGFDTIGISPREKELITRQLCFDLLEPLYLKPCREEGIGFPKGFILEEYHIQSPAPDLLLSEGDTIDLGGRQLRVMETPGHTQGSLSFLDDKNSALFCGDLVYDGTLYAHFQDSDLAAYKESLERLSNMGISKIFPAHNSPVGSVELISKALALVTAILKGETMPRKMMDWGEPVLVHTMGELAMLTHVPGSGGIDLLACRQKGSIL